MGNHLYNENGFVFLGSEVRIGQAAEIFDALITTANRRQAVVIDSSNVVKVDAAGLQALVAGILYLRNTGITWQWQNGFGELTEAIQILGLHEALMMP